MVIRRTLASVQPVPREVQAFTTGEPLLARLRQPGVWAAATSVLIPTVTVMLTQPPRAAAIAAEPAAIVGLQPRDLLLVRPVHTQIQSKPVEVANRQPRKAAK